MAKVIHLRCHHCGEPLHGRDAVYCPRCNLALAYRAMPFLLGMILTGHLIPGLADLPPHDIPVIERDPFAPDDEATLDLAALNWE